jgi:succinoglycan biosynthesis transport protein ExoP
VLTSRSSSARPVGIPTVTAAVPLQPRATKELRDYLEVLRRRKWLVAAVLSTVVFVVYTGTKYFVTQQYTAAATLRVVSRSALSSQSVRADDIEYLNRLQDTYARIAQSNPLLAQLQRRLGLSSPPRVSVVVRPNSELMSIKVTAPNATLAARAANGLSGLLIGRLQQLDTAAIDVTDSLFVKRIGQLEHEIAREQARVDHLMARAALTPAERLELLELREDVRIKQGSAVAQRTQYEQDRLVEQQRANTLSMILPATRPTHPSSPRLKLNLALGIFFGLLGGIGLAFLFENLTTRLQSTEDIQEISGSPVLGRIPSVRLSSAGLVNGARPAAEAFRRLRTTLFTLGRDRQLSTILVTSAEPDEGKSTIVANLGVSVAQSGHTVLIVDADLRLPSQHVRFQLKNEPGLADVLSGDASLEDALRRTAVPGLTVLTAGRRPLDETELLRTAMPALLASAAERFDVVLIDSPAILPVADTLAMAPAMDAVLLVAGQGATRREALEAACQELERFDVQLLGVVVNRAGAQSYRYYS